MSPPQGRIIRLLPALLLAACNTGPSTACELRLSGGVSYATECHTVTFTSVSGLPESVYTDSLLGPVSVRWIVEYMGAPFGIGDLGAADGDGARLVVHAPAGDWVAEVGSGPDSGSVAVTMSSVGVLRSTPDTTIYQAHGTLQARLVPATFATHDTVALRITF